jgi:hypothetical protein
VNPESTFEKDLQDALIAWQEGSHGINEERTTELLQRVRDDATFRKALALQVSTLTQARLAQAPEPRWLELNEVLGIENGNAGTSHEDAEFDATLRAALQDEPSHQPTGWAARWSWLGLAATITVAGILTIWLTLRPANREIDLRKAPPLAVLVQVEDANAAGTWGSQPPSSGMNLTAGPLILKSGRLSLMFASGVVLHAEGPAKLDLLTPDRVLCHDGRVRLRVPKGAEGFCIETPGGAVTDLGTELGVSVGKDGNTQVAVFEGEAEASLRIPGQEGVRTELLTAHQSAKLIPSTGEIVTTAPDLAGFLPATELHVPPLQLAAGYEEKISASHPVHYWRMDRLEQGLIPNEVAGAPALRPVGGMRLETAAPESPTTRTVAHFGGKTNPGALYAVEPWLAPGAAHAVEMWFASTTTEQMSLFAFTTGKAPNDHLELVELAVRQPGRSPRPGIVRYLTRWPAGSGGGINIYTEPKFLPYQWHHLVAQQANGKMELYLNGHRVGKADADPFAPQIPCTIQFGCLRYNEGRALAQLQRTFAGKMAEVAIYNRLLTTEEIRERATSDR